ncbi:putative leucine rich repeat domain protein [Phaeomoniella chlamydospora]|uniref:Putative leucine rich repeat domain protein n=1 Tax=Phaeomoniella chlamydospora TaxID=158046 RepID=A0A0G2ERG7_PHACM|nr:putative leucine rich repeat domain protein [Phaeomoniella chlamydospora]
MDDLSNDHENDVEVDLPPFPPASSLSTFERSTRHVKPALGRKRTWDPNDAFANSSDPAVFSSDDYQSGSLEDYATKRRRKHQWRGTWWGEKSKRLSFNSSQSCVRRGTMANTKTQREFKRNYDSGIFMGSEGTDSSFDDEFLEHNKVKEGSLPGSGEKIYGLDAQEVPQGTSLHGGDSGPRVSGLEMSTIVSSGNAKDIIQRCLEEGREDIDLSQEAYESLEPHLRIFLSNNILTSIPSELFNLSTLSVLSVRQNRLTEIPAAIGKLANLSELNVGGNQLEVLAWEILEMMEPHKGNLVKFCPFPNPFRRFHEREMIHPASIRRRKGYIPGKVVRIRSPTGTESIAKQVAKSSVTLFDRSGMTHRLPANMRAKTAVAGTADASNALLGAARTQSLVELSLRATTKLPYFSDLARELTAASTTSPAESGHSLAPPENLTRFLTLASNVVEAGGQHCPTCGKAFIIPRAEWIEWWDLLPQHITSKDLERLGETEISVAGHKTTATGEMGHASGSNNEDSEIRADSLRIEEDESMESEGDETSPNGRIVAGQGLNGQKKRSIFANVVPFRKRVCSWGCIDA